MKNNNTGETIDVANYTLDSTQGNFTLLPNDYWNSSTQTGHDIVFVDYSYKHADYGDDSGSRNIINLIILFATLELVIFSIVLIMDPSSTLGRLVRGGGTGRL